MALNGDPSYPVESLKDLGGLASWSVSSAKPFCGAEHLYDPNTTTLWQSEGPQPHLINIHFSKRQTLSQISIFADVNLDDSYTPQRLSLRAGNHHGDLHEIRYVELTNPTGWQHFRLASSPTDPNENPIRAHVVQIAIISNHLNGKDTHVRGVRLYSPKEPAFSEDYLPFGTTVFKMHDGLR